MYRTAFIQLPSWQLVQTNALLRLSLKYMLHQSATTKRNCWAKLLQQRSRALGTERGAMGAMGAQKHLTHCQANPGTGRISRDPLCCKGNTVLIWSVWVTNTNRKGNHRAFIRPKVEICAYNAKVKLWPLKVRWSRCGHFKKMDLKGFTLL